MPTGSKTGSSGHVGSVKDGKHEAQSYLSDTQSGCITMLLLLPAFASTLDVPVRAVYQEYTGWGEDPVVVDDVLSATVSVQDVDAGTVFPATGELLVSERTGTGSGELVFDADPSNTLHTWAVYLLDANGNPLGSPQILDIQFGSDGDGTIAARTTADIIVRKVTVKKRNISRIGTPPPKTAPTPSP